MKTLAVIICLLICFSSLAQLSVDSIKTDEDVKDFLLAYGKKNSFDWKDISVRNFKADDDRMSKRIQYLDSLNKTKWIIDDFNNDGKKDLIFNSIINNQRYFFSLLSKNDNGYEYFNLHKSYHSYTSYDLGKMKQGEVIFLLINNISTSLIEKDWLEKHKPDTLFAAYGGFTEKRKITSSSLRFDTLDFYYVFSPYYVPPYYPQSMHISLDRKNSVISYGESGRLQPQTDYENSRGIGTNLSADNYLYSDTVIKNEIESLLMLTDLPNIQDSFVTSLHDRFAVIRLKNGKKEKFITDYGLEGSYWLRLFYTKMFTISKRLRTDMAKYFQENNFLELEQY